MGHELTSEGLHPDSRKMPSPTDKLGVMRLLGMATYLAKFVPNFSEVTSKLRELQRTDTEFRWDDSIHGKAFQELKEMFTTGPVLRFYDVTKPVVVQCDASSTGLGAVILQNGRPVEFASRAKTPTEINSYAQIEKEMLAIVFDMTRFHAYVYGKHDVTVHSDHKPLMAIVKTPLTAAPHVCNACC